MADNYNPNNGAPNNYGYQNNNYQNNGYQNNGYNNYPQYEPGKRQCQREPDITEVSEQRVLYFR